MFYVHFSWYSPLPQSSCQVVKVRLLVYRDAPGKTRKLYFDSDTTTRTKVNNNDAVDASEKNVIRQAGFEFRVRNPSNITCISCCMWLRA